MVWDRTFEIPFKPNNTLSYTDEISDALHSIQQQDIDIQNSINPSPKPNFYNSLQFCNIPLQNKNNCFIIFKPSDCYKGTIQSGIQNCDTF